jgi:hydroxyethylthiazole kinase-like uncharacterized protein yjeF
MMLAQAYNRQMHNHTINQPKYWQHLLPKLSASSHKYNRGYAFIYGGYPMTGAARLAALAAARVGAGITVIAAPEIAFPVYASQLLSVMVKPYTDDSTLAQLVADDRINAYLIGPGAGLNQQTHANTLRMLHTGKPVVIDADALTMFAGDTQPLSHAITGTCVLTPHAGEFARLTGTEVASSLSLRIAQAQQATQTFNATLLLKGAISIIAAPDGRILLNDNAPPTLATAGAGDVLAGLITGLLAQGMPAFEATAAASWIHGRAASTFGTGLIADDLPAIIPNVLRAFESPAPDHNQ